LLNTVGTRRLIRTPGSVPRGVKFPPTDNVGKTAIGLGPISVRMIKLNFYRISRLNIDNYHKNN
jgi:hypothetical protein